MKLGLDIHGVINANPKFFALLSRLARDRGHEVHIITGVMLTKSKLAEIHRYGVSWTHLFSISDYHRLKGTPMTFADSENPWIDADLWDRTKASYCDQNNISFHIDDTLSYGEYFQTPFALFDFEHKRLDWHYRNLKRGAFLIEDPEKTLDLIEKVVIDTSNA